jgi:hypothetical protein
MNPNLIDLAKETKNPDVSLDGKPSNTIYVPSIDLYVSENLEMEMGRFWEIRKKMKEIGARMLTLAEWWEFYDFCEQHRPDLIDFQKSEWLNLYFTEKKAAYEIGPGTVAKSERIITLPQRDGNFYREDTIPETGIPGLYKTDGNWHFCLPFGRDKVLTRNSFKSPHLGTEEGGEFFFLSARESHMNVGVRLCYRK